MPRLINSCTRLCLSSFLKNEKKKKNMLSVLSHQLFFDEFFTLKVHFFVKSIDCSNDKRANNTVAPLQPVQARPVSTALTRYGLGEEIMND